MTRDRQGRLIVCSYGDRIVWRLEPDGTITTLASHYDGRKINTPNDVVVKSDGAIYWTDATGGLTNPGMGGADLQQYLDYKAVFRLSPDGMTVTPLFTDNQGPNGIAFSPEGQVLESHRIPVDRPTNCTFGDPDLRMLYIATVKGHFFPRL